MRTTSGMALCGLLLAVLLAAERASAAPTADASNLPFLSADQQLKVYKAVDKYYTTRVVRRGPKVRPLAYASRRSFPAVTWKGRTYTDANAFMTAARMSGVLVLKHGTVVFEGYALGRRPGDRWISFSVAKSVTSVLIGAAIQDGAITSLDDPVGKYVPQVAGGGYDGVTIRQLLTMTSGVRWSEKYDDPGSDTNRIRGWPGEPGMSSLVSYLRRLPRESTPGSRFQYKTGDTDLAGVVLRNSIGKNLADYLSEKIWRPYGMERGATWLVDRNGQEKGGSSLSFTLRDYARFGMFVAGGGRINGHRVVPEAYLEQATSNQLTPGSKDGYGFFWWMDPDGFSAKGIFGQLIRIDRKDDLIMVVNSAWHSATDPAGIEAWNALFDAFRTANPEHRSSRPHEAPTMEASRP